MDRARLLAESLREHLAGIMLDALKREGGIHLSDEEYYRLKECLMDAMQGMIRL